MSINIDDLSPAQQAALLAELNERARRANSDQRTGEEIDKALRASLQERGMSVGCVWEDPEGRSTRAYPKGWVAQHADHWWQAQEHAVLSEPGPDNPEWSLNDPAVDEPTLDGENA